MKRTDEVAACGTSTKVLATTMVKTATTRMSVEYEKTRNSVLPVWPTYASTTSPMLLPWWRMEAINDAKSWTAPMKTPPIRIQR
mgnify:CR=1 FL=1